MDRIRSTICDTAPVLVLAVIAAVGSFTHISELAARHGQLGWQSWAVAVCIDLMCVMAARELQRDKRTGRRRRGRVTWPALVLTGGIVLTLAANLATARPTVWGWITAATPAVAFLVSVSMLERRASHQPPVPAETDAVETDTETPEVVQVEPVELPSAEPVPESAVSPGLLAYARRLADDHHTKHRKPITGDQLATRMHVSADVANDLLALLRREPVVA
ncbi:DUF2637 domain-containing protein [Nonomuraea wenchangensis]|uniref:DUF2637 domain-containing protein n=1 Tax=Nonomuraea wenchangensis TaxID=568860 RepID=A0A1I0LT68_9ACTN|nr:DUF2637 domain-containing protein [Nonomuraea wenchangensis]SEU46092.1 Protein of unknown function [Nonomuraea wenchangensis]